ncbi:hypothetical protein QN386_05710 [Pseudomonas sp. CCI3.2]|uniref:hypothetical protein n=1 Tax=unclassified Pseudomonas TaxID=196821 RepID=UPI002AC97E72|nr:MULTISPECIES: hypothetical protein [unclassified Pseudomonas]MEB0076426.1 hypothetical protein [Pseudomonas sp. MH10out]MEB0091225.1 hypothetical protein [Pseudomonas sp. CCI4.2]MEB0100821.1 hypothetical protein [Pseudomonas sp. CCI3.2]MEB0128794.1 hypothetical protein [Pseudomonas sp. CCI2.4]MEB0156979.1 hypothetical protein [Pseudomonas sp. AH2 (2023)]
MSFFSKNTVVMALSLTALLAGISSYAATPAAAATKLSTLGGKFAFSLPRGYIARPLPPGDAKNGTAGATGTMYVNKDEKRVIIAAENALPNGLKASDNDDVFLDNSVAGFVRQQSEALPGFKQTSENRMTIKGLGIREIDSTATMGGGNTLNTTFLSGSGNHMSVVQVVSRADDQAGHSALIKRIIEGLKAR